MAALAGGRIVEQNREVDEPAAGRRKAENAIAYRRSPRRSGQLHIFCRDVLGRERRLGSAARMHVAGIEHPTVRRLDAHIRPAPLRKASVVSLRFDHFDAPQHGRDRRVLETGA
jgi:hypothetical protein